MASSGAPVETPTAVVPRLAGQAVIDGRLDEEIWKKAEVIRAFYQVEPHPGGAPSEATEVRIFQSGQSLFIGVRATDSNTAGIIARELKRDADQSGDDRFAVVIDPLGDQRGGYLFQTNPRGARYDALIVARTLNVDWTGIWEVRTQMTADGWTAEFEIPFASLSFREDGRTWGLNLERVVSRKQETTRWSAVSRNQRAWHVGNIGRMSGFTDLQVGHGIDFKPYAKGSWGRERTGDRDLAGDGGFELFYKLTATSTAALTVNPDFADTDVDDRVINVTRFPTFLPERREFFLRDAGVFQFGGITSSPLPYFSRRIGLDARGRTVDIPVGIKLTGRTDRLAFGVLDTQTRDEDGRTRNLGVARARVDLWAESTGGLIFTRGSAQGGASDWLGGADFNYRTSSWRGNRSIGLNLFALRTASPAAGTAGGAYGVNMDFPTDRVNLSAGLLRVDDEFSPPLGFVRQAGIYRASGKVVLRWRPERTIDYIDWGSAVDYVTRLNGDLDYFEASLIDTTLYTRRRDSFGGSWFVYRERLLRPLSIGPGVLVPAGVYDTARASAWCRTGASRPFKFTALVSHGGLYDGTSWDTTLSFGGKASRFLHTFLDYDQLDATLPQGRFRVRIVGARADVLFSPDFALMLVGQWDDLSEDLGLNMRLRWTPRPGRELVAVFSQNVDTRSGWNPAIARLVTKVSWTFRF